MLFNVQQRFPELRVFKTIREIVLPPEPQEGNIEYKRHLIGCNIHNRATQLKWRISESEEMEAIYYIGVDDNGSIRGLNDVIKNIEIMMKICEIAGASIRYVEIICPANILQISLKNKQQTIEHEYKPSGPDVRSDG